MHIPFFFLANNFLSKPGDIVLDPFCGSGTVLLESLLMGRNAIGFDANPLAQLISKVKTSPIDTSRLQKSIDRLKRRIPEKHSIEVPDVINLEYWFYPHVIKKLLRLLEAIHHTRDKDVKSFFLVCFSNCIRQVSLADPRLSVPVRLRYGQYPEGHWLREKTDRHLSGLLYINVLERFNKILENNYNRIVSFKGILPSGVKAKVIGSDARKLKFDIDKNKSVKAKIKDNTVDLVITSPPYIGAQKYIRASSLNLGWLGLCESPELRKLEEQSLGREHYCKDSYQKSVSTGLTSADKVIKELRSINPLRGHIAANYLIEMRDAFKEISRVLKPNGYMVLVAANNQVCGQEFKTQHYLRLIAEEMGFTLVLRLLDDIRSRGLMTKRNRTASLITREWVLLFQKNRVGNGRAN
jgi:DNA modification methylase